MQPKGRLNGKSVLKTLGRVGIVTQDEARQAARELFRDLGAGVHPHQKKMSAMTLSETLAAYLDGNDLKPRTREAYADLINRYFPDWTDLPLKDISREMVEARHLDIGRQVEGKHLKRRTSMDIDPDNKPLLSSWVFDDQNLLDLYNRTYGQKIEAGSPDDWQLGQEIEIITDKDLH